ncbi:MAG: Stp1/IreP family PP2C-type Ser/Thr phosphatase [Lachnospiraceae bacterium]|nr:Stp1/IreP family PP2C-type Ser/Thr phosphatase [Lachnospiraceae bacterium]
MKSYGKKDIGCIRTENQDYIFYTDEPIGMLKNLYIVADGMGGHNAGAYASKFVTEQMVENARKSKGWDVVAFLENVLKQLNYELLQKGAREEAYAGMGTTTVAASEKEGILYVVNVGDSRLYHIHNQEIKQITVDHSYVQELISAGVIDKEDGRNHPNKNMITRAIGAPQSLNVDHFIVPLQEGDYVLLCSDGLHGMLEDQEIRDIVLGAGTVEEKTNELIERAKQKGGKDNIAVILTRMGNRGDKVC